MHGPASEGARVLACTVVARNYLPAARVLAQSYVDHHPGHEFVIAVTDGGVLDEVDGAIRTVGSQAFGIDAEDYLRMATAYNVTELATSVKPYLLRELRRSHGTDSVVIYLDPDIVVYAPMPELAPLAAQHGIVLTPHHLAPMPRDGKEPGEAVLMGTGVFNLGFIATGPGSEAFLDFWAERLRHDAIVAPGQQLFTDQRWVDQVPALFDHTVLRDPGFNVAYWNLHERPLTSEDGAVRAGGEPLRFFHFSGYRPERPWLLTLHCARKPRVLLSEHPVLRRLCDDYGAALRSAGYAETLESIPYGFNTFGDGMALTPAIRRLFRDGWVAAERPAEGHRQRVEMPPHAFGADDGKALREWLRAPEDTAQRAAGLHRLAVAAWRSRTDLQLAFPHPTGADADAFRHWCAGSGVAEGLLPEWAAPTDPEPKEPPRPEFGVNIAGYLTAELGLGEMGRIVHKAVTDAGVNVASVIEERSLSNRTRADHDGEHGRPEYPISILAVNADQTPVLLANHPELAHERYVIGLWAWELEDFPSWQHNAFDLVDEVWTVSDFCRAAIAENTTIPVRTIPVPVRDPGEPQHTTGDKTQFLFAFDFNSVGARKNPWGLVAAFQRAFPGRDDVRLVIKAINGELNPHNAERLRVAIADDSRIELIEKYISSSELDELYRSSNCYVSLHRSEGFGLTVAEAMARALPVIATDYSSTTEFFDETCGWPVPYRLTSVGKGNFPYQEDAVWADPDLDAAAQAMRAVANDPDEAARRGRAGREHVLRTRSMAAASEWFAEQLRHAYARWLQRRDTAEPPPLPNPLEPLHESRQALHWRPDTSAPSRTPLAPALRKAVVRAIDHYDVHQRRVMGALADGSEQATARLLARVESLEARLAAAERDAASKTHVRAELDKALRPVLRRTARTVDDLRTTDTRVQDLFTAQLRTNDGFDAAIHQVQAELAEARRALELLRHHASHDDLGKLADRLHHFQQWTQERLRAADARTDADEHTLQAVKRDLEAVHEAARMPHAPLPSGTDVTVCDAGALLLPEDSVVRGWISYHRWWERPEAELLAALMHRRPGAFLDVGAHVGYHTLRLLRSCPEATAAIAVEADPANFACLERNIAVNLPAETAARVHALEAAAWDSDGVVELVHAEQDNSGDHRVRPPTGNEHAVEVPALRLDHVPEVATAGVSVIKLDLQGRDHRAIAGLRRVLETDRPEIVCEFCPDDIVELGDDPHEALAGYRALGYSPRIVTEDASGDDMRNDADLVRLARADTTGFLTLWLTPGTTPGR